MDTHNLSSNWKKLQASGSLLSKTLNRKTKVKHNESRNQLPQRAPINLKRKRSRMPDDSIQITEAKGQQESVSTLTQSKNLSERINEGLAPGANIGKYLAIDCEMVGVGPNPHLESALARVSVVNYDGDQIYDSYVKPREEVTDWRTPISGIEPKHMIQARSFEEVQAAIADLLKGRIVIGHSVRSDFEALLLDHPKRDIRDTARHGPYRQLAGGGSPKLKILASEILGLTIQEGEHSSVEDARATMLLFQKDKEIFEREHIKKWGLPINSTVNKIGEATSNSSKGKKSNKKKGKKKK